MNGLKNEQNYLLTYELVKNGYVGYTPAALGASTIGGFMIPDTVQYRVIDTGLSVLWSSSVFSTGLDYSTQRTNFEAAVNQWRTEVVGLGGASMGVPSFADYYVQPYPNLFSASESCLMQSTGLTTPGTYAELQYTLDGSTWFYFHYQAALSFVHYVRRAYIEPDQPFLPVYLVVPDPGATDYGFVHSQFGNGFAYVDTADSVPDGVLPLMAGIVASNLNLNHHTAIDTRLFFVGLLGLEDENGLLSSPWGYFGGILPPVVFGYRLLDGDING